MTDLGAEDGERAEVQSSLIRSSRALVITGVAVTGDLGAEDGERVEVQSSLIRSSRALFITGVAVTGDLGAEDGERVDGPADGGVEQGAERRGHHQRHAEAGRRWTVSAGLGHGTRPAITDSVSGADLIGRLDRSSP
jgi:hypothetical protein